MEHPRAPLRNSRKDWNDAETLEPSSCIQQPYLKLLKTRPILLSLLLLGLSAPASAAVHVERLRCEYLDNPLGIDTPQPRLSWIITSSERGIEAGGVSSPRGRQRSRSGEKPGGPVGQRQGRVRRDRADPLRRQAAGLAPASILEGSRLGSGGRHQRERSGPLGNGSPPTRRLGRKMDRPHHRHEFEPRPLLRRVFQLDGKIRQARAYICGLGYYELYLNGQQGRRPPP